MPAITDEEIREYGIERVQWESLTAYQAFLYFAALSPLKRREGNYFREIAELTGLADTTVRSYISSFKWDERVAIIDAKRFLRREHEFEVLQRENIVKYVNANKDIKDKSIELSRKILEKCIDFANTELMKTEYKLKPHELSKLYETSVKMSRLVSDLPTEITSTQILSPEELDRMTPEQLQALLEKEQGDILNLEGIQNIKTEQ